MAGNISSVSNTGVSAGTQTVGKAGSERQVQKDIGDLGKALHANDAAAAQNAVASLRAAAPTQNSNTDFSNALKALDQALKSNNSKGATEAFANLQQARKEIQKERVTSPASDVPQRPKVSGANDTAQIQKAGQARHEQQATERSFITRKDIESKAVASNTKAGAEVGRHIDTTA